MRPFRFFARAFAALFLLSNLAPAHAAADPAPGTGVLEGIVRGTDGEPASDVNVMVPALRRGTLTDEHGRWRLEQIPPGRWTVVARTLGAAGAEASVELPPGGRVPVALRLGESLVVKRLDPTIVVAPPADVRASDTRHTVTKLGLEIFRPNDLTDLVKLKPGVVLTPDGLHVRGGRNDEIKTRVSGVEVTDPLTSGNATVPLMSVAGADLLTGGLDAEHGDALSGILDVQTREGGEKFSGDLRWDTDRFGGPDKTYDDFDRVALGMGGPLLRKDLTWFASAEGTFSNTYLPNGRAASRRTLLDFVQLGDRQDNVVRSSLKLAWKPGSGDQWSLEQIRSRSRRTPYDHMWSRHGYVQVLQDTAHEPGAGTPAPRWGTWSATPLDSTFVEMNMADHLPTTEDRFEQWTLAWTRTFGGRDVWTTRLAQVAFGSHTGVGGKVPWEYDTQSPFYWNGNQGPGTEGNPYFATHGDYPFWEDRTTRSFTLKSDFATRRWPGHRAKAGFEARTTHVRNRSLIGPGTEVAGLPGVSRSDYANTYPEGSLYVQDRWDYEGLTLNAGLRGDAFSPGGGVGREDLPSGRRWKLQLSPRLGVAHPITDRDALNFHYGWTYQTPTRHYVFENRDPLSTVPVRGNPDLEPQTNVEYQAGMQHLFSRDVAGSFSVFYRDIYGLITVRRERDESGNLVSRYVNNDYASARGFEASLTRSFSHRFAAEANYSYAIATGVASDPRSALQFYNGGRLYLPIGERALDWDQRHTLSLQASLREPDRWGLHLTWAWSSGRPFTPTFRNDRRADPAFVNSRRLPATSTLSLNADRYARLWGQGLTLFLDVRNALDAKNLVNPAPGGVTNPFVDLDGISDYLAYYTETGRTGGAYLQDVNGDQRPEWVALHDPRVFDEGRNLRLGASVRF